VRPALLLLSLVLLSFGVRSGQTPAEQAKAEILRIHEQDRAAHLHGDASYFASRTAPEYISVADGKLSRGTPNSMTKQFETYFSVAKHKAWDDLEAPVIHVSPDGNMAWAIYRVHSQFMETKPDGSRAPSEFVCAWTSTYEKSAGHWAMTSVTSTFEPQNDRGKESR